jgi:methionine-rich copper-binding protein CopC
MTRQSIAKIALSLVFAFPVATAYAHAQLESATPPVGGTIASASEVRLHFSEGVEPRFSGLTLSAASGAAATLGAAKTQPGDPTVLIVPIAKPLAPGVYTVRWHAVSVDTHHTQGSFEFTVKP